MRVPGGVPVLSAGGNQDDDDDDDEMPELQFQLLFLLVYMVTQKGVNNRHPAGVRSGSEQNFRVVPSHNSRSARASCPSF